MPAGSVFVGNIPYDATEATLGELFAEAGPVRELRLVADRDSGKLRGYGFVEYDDYATAMSAVRNLNGREYNGRALRVDHAETMAMGGGKQPTSGGGADAVPAPARGTMRADAPVGAEHAKYAQTTGMAHAFEGGSMTPTGAAMDLLTKRVADLTPTQMYEIMSQMKQMQQSDPTQARTLLIQNPQLSLALFQAQLVLGMVKPPSSAAPAQAPAARAPAAAPPPAHQAAPVAPHMMQQQPVRGRGGVPPPPPPVRQAVPPPPAPGAAAAAPAADQQQALLRQVLAMTPDQIAILPPDQRQQVEYLRQLAAQQGMVRI
jgi:cleavage stimulation factor subunit 2